MFTVKFIYNDDKDLTVNIEEENLREFFECLDKKQFYLHQNYELGFWTNIDTVRYIEIKKVSTCEDPRIEQETKTDGQVIS